jgi:tetratricopeptide (TPR) repeat protein
MAAEPVRTSQFLQRPSLVPVVRALLCVALAAVPRNLAAAPQENKAGTCSARADLLTSEGFPALSQIEASERIWTPTVSVLEITRKVPRGARNAFKEAMKYSRKSHLGEAQQQLKKALRIAPTYFQANAAMAVMLFNSRRYSAARDYARRAHKTDPSYAPALRVLGAIDVVEGDYSRAAKELSEALRLSPRHPGARWYLELARSWQSECAEDTQHLEEIADEPEPGPHERAPLMQTVEPPGLYILHPAEDQSSR